MRRAKAAMEAVLSICCGVDIHKDTAVACLMKVEGGEVKSEAKTFSTMTEGLLKLRQWLLEAGCTHVAVESTGVYWKPLFNVLEDAVTVVLANARHIKNVPGRKTDVKDCEWLAKLLLCGLIKGSFIPPKPIRELRDLTRYRRQIEGTKASEKNRILKILEDANIKLDSVASDVFGVSGRKMLEALRSGETDGKALAGLAVGKLKNKKAELKKALQGKVSEHHLYMIQKIMKHIEYLEDEVAELDIEIGKRTEGEKDQLTRLQTIDGVSETTAVSIMAEVGTDMSVFPSQAHIASWAGICPGNNESAGKKRADEAGTGISG